MRIFLYSFLLVCSSVAWSKTDPEDSLSQVYLHAENDSTRIETLIRWSAFYGPGESEQSLQKLNKALDLAIRSQQVRMQGKVIEEMGIVFSNNNNPDSSIYYYDIALQRYLSIGDSTGASKACYKIGRVYFYSSDFEKALEFFKRADTYNDNTRNPSLVSQATSKMAIGVVYEEIDSLQLAIYYQELALKIKRENNLEIHIPVSLNNLAVLHGKTGNIGKARALLNESIEISERIGEYKALAFAQLTLGNLLMQEKRYPEAVSMMQKAISFWELSNSLRDLQEGYRSLYNAYKNIGDDSEALYYLEKTTSIKDSIYSEDRLLSMQEFDSKFKSREKEMTIQNQKLQIEKEVREKELAEEQKTMQFYLFSSIIILLLLNGVYLVYIYLRKRRDQKLILIQKLELEEKNSEIVNSINYAKRLQEAILPDGVYFKNNFSDSFIYYQPKDIVAGDFYWFEKTKDTLLFAVADCTGHGVPGAIVSVVCSNALAKVVLEFGLTDPGEILDAVRKLIVEAFKKGGKEMKDGMDISICALSLSSRTLKWAGANNPIWIVQKENDENIVEIKGDKQPVGDFVHQKKFTTHQVDITNGDSIYLFSDGYADQFGGEKGKKFKYQAFKKLLFDNRKKAMSEQLQVLSDTFNQWRGDYEQVDDVCVIGIRF